MYIRSAVVGLFATILVGCDGTEPVSPVPRSNGAKVSAEGNVVPSSLEAAFDQIAREVPEFAGIHFKDGKFVVGVTSLERSERAQELAKSILVSRVKCRPTYDCHRETHIEARTELVKHSWHELREAREKVRDLYSSVWLDIDERSNEVVVGVPNGTATAGMRDALDRSGVRSSIARLIPQPIEVSTNTATLSSRVRPIVGGLEIGPRGCSLMTVGFADGLPRFVTNGHCTQSQYSPDNLFMSQPWGGVSFGFEVFDAAPYSCGPLINRKRCRRADLALYSVVGVDIVGNETEIDPGRLARPSQRLLGSSQQPGPTDIVGTLEVIGTFSWLVYGEPIDRIGRKTGWQTGWVTGTCIDANYPSNTGDVTIVCSDRANTFSQGGDSGGPMFRYSTAYNGSAFLVGINHGTSTSNPNYSSIYSSLNQMQQEVPSLCFWQGC